ncbi:RBBP8 N-terminal-like protein isoform X1 [Monodelphis domestica]|uniref:RBBP8 N-terminal-like protein isoform X1 n=2 Tax=Monodelphis domestica TaxID=13616 RepID=UPI0024E274D1|nr:RBBP8 N-terminal-like protein isoform X1 [Monodelphis domestica]XP_016283969.2 RBBP8 N-terminal-like protein isoform X1 [Monodelphis domestica]
MDSFTESLNKLKDVHEKEVLGLQNKLLELNTEKCRDAQRIEELFAKNHQLREQQKALKENVKVLENRLRAGLCDRCMVTQELAKKKQHEYENSHLQSLQHIFILTNEMNGLKEENKALKEELKRLRSLEDRPKHHRAMSRESSSSPDSPVPLLSPAGRKSSTEKPPPSRETEEDYLPHTPLGEEKSTGYQTSPIPKIPPGSNLQEQRVLDMNPQRISNQLHGTIAVVRPGSRACLSEKSSSEAPTPPPPRSSPPSPPYDRNHTLDSYLKTNKEDSRETASSYESLKLTARSEHLCLLNRHLSLHRFGLRSHCPSPTGAQSFSRGGLKGGEGEEVRSRLQEDWEDRQAFLDLPGAIVYMRDQRLEGTLQFLEQREKLQYLLAQQQLRGLRVRVESTRDRDSELEEKQSSPPQQAADSGGKETRREEKHALREPCPETVRPPLLVGSDCSEPREKEEMIRNYALDKPLDLSDYGRCREGSRLPGWLKSPSSPETRSPSPRLGERPPAQKSKGIYPLLAPETLSKFPASNPQDVRRGADRVCSQERDEPPATLEQMPSPQGHHPSKLASDEAEQEPGIRLRLSLGKQEADGQPDTNHMESTKTESDELDTSDSEVAPNYDPETKQEIQGEDLRYFCVKDKIQGLPKKRKREQDPWSKVAKKSPRGRRRLKGVSAPSEEEGSPKEEDNPSPTSSNGTSEETSMSGP